MGAWNIFLLEIEAEVFLQCFQGVKAAQISSNWAGFFVTLYTRGYKCSIGCYLYVYVLQKVNR